MDAQQGRDAHNSCATERCSPSELLPSTSQHSLYGKEKNFLSALRNKDALRVKTWRRANNMIS
eukprot:6847487-Alexandrium_andersonii.AAC.1